MSTSFSPIGVYFTVANKNYALKNVLKEVEMKAMTNKKISAHAVPSITKNKQDKENPVLCLNR